MKFNPIHQKRRPIFFVPLLIGDTAGEKKKERKEEHARIDRLHSINDYKNSDRPFNHRLPGHVLLPLFFPLSAMNFRLESFTAVTHTSANLRTHSHILKVFETFWKNISETCLDTIKVQNKKDEAFFTAPYSSRVRDHNKFEPIKHRGVRYESIKRAIINMTEWWIKSLELNRNGNHDWFRTSDRI